MHRVHEGEFARVRMSLTIAALALAFTTPASHAMAPATTNPSTNNDELCTPDQWDPQFFVGGFDGVADGSDGSTLWQIAVADDGIYVTGVFEHINDLTVNHIARWDGTSWSALGTGLNGRASFLAMDGNDLYAAGSFSSAGGVAVNNVAKYDGASWSALGEGLDGNVDDLSVVAGDLYAIVDDCSSFVGGSCSLLLEKWDGTSWSKVSGGPLPDAPSYIEWSIGRATFDGKNIYAERVEDDIEDEQFAYASVIEWDGTSWSTIGSADSDWDSIYAMAVVGGDLYIGGFVDSFSGNRDDNVARWDGARWYASGAGKSDVTALETFGSELYVGGGDSVAVGDGTSWSSLQSGIDTWSIETIGVGASGLYAGGSLTLATWDGTTWAQFGPQELDGNGVDGTVQALAVDGSSLYAAGQFQWAGNVFTGNIARWNGTSWSAVGNWADGMQETVTALAIVGDQLYAGGRFQQAGDVSARSVARWDGASWSSLGSGIEGEPYTGSGEVRAMAVIGTDLYVAGNFRIAGGVPAKNVARWDGNAWSALGAGTNGIVKALAVVGEDLVAAGTFSSAGGVAVGNIAKWDGKEWSPLGAGVGEYGIRALAAIGSDLYAAGWFTSAGDAPANSIARWDGDSWSALGAGLERTSYSGAGNTLAVRGTDLYVGGLFTSAGGVAAGNVARWDGATWSATGGGVDFVVDALAVTGTELWIGGWFGSAGGKASSNIARYSTSCGNCIVDADEQCDDGDVESLPGQYCSSQCSAVTCGVPSTPNAVAPHASDALFALRSAVGLVFCDLRVCDVNGDSKLTALDALRILRAAVGLGTELRCPLELQPRP